MQIERNKSHFRCSQAWPDDALERVAYKYLETVDITDEDKKSTVFLCKYFHTSAAKLGTKLVTIETGYLNDIALNFILSNSLSGNW